MATIDEISDEIVRAWSEGANTTLPDRQVRATWYFDIRALAELVLNNKLTVQDIYDYTYERCQIPFQRQNPQLWSLKFIRYNIFAWLQVQGPKDFPPPDGYRNHIDHLGCIHTWDRRTGQEIISEQSPESTPRQTSTHGTPYIPLAPNEQMVKRLGSEGFVRDFFLDSSDLSDQELRCLRDLTE
jgi:hypothetical protein